MGNDRSIIDPDTNTANRISRYFVGSRAEALISEYIASTKSTKYPAKDNEEATKGILFDLCELFDIEDNAHTASVLRKGEKAYEYRVEKALTDQQVEKMANALEKTAKLLKKCYATNQAAKASGAIGKKRRMRKRKAIEAFDERIDELEILRKQMKEF